MAIQGVTPSVDFKAAENSKVERADSLANEMKNIKRKRAERELLQDPKLAKKLMAAQASPIYNSNGEIIQTTGFNGF
jgi:putative ubiquitin-RnfH superfamily antitoxin RatB of RatAB toxin-antitoxin module